jgi:HK97 family phage major capsid protein
MQADLFTKGGALVAPLQVADRLIKFVDDEVFVRRYAYRTVVTNADGLGAPELTSDPADADWTSELATGGNDSTMALGRRELRPHPLAKRIKVSNKLMRLTAGGIEGLVLQRLAYKFAITDEKAFLTGDGVQKPLGVFTASADGITTARDVSTDNTTTAITADGLINVKHSIKGQYWARLRWLFHRDAIRNIRKLKDGNGQYIWAPGLAGGIPDRILESPYDMSEYAPNTFTTGLYVGLIGDWSQYWIVDALDLTIQRLVELYAETNQTGFIGRMETDGAPVLAEAFARVKLA